MHRCYYTGPVEAGQSLTIEGDEARHVMQALRARVNEPVELLNGQGRCIRAEIRSLNRRSFTCEVTEHNEVEPDEHRVTLVQALLKGGNFETILQKAVELGIHAIHPIVTAHTISRAPKMERWEAVCISAMKQSGNPCLPTIHPLCEMDAFIDRYAETFDRLILADLSEAAGPLRVALQPSLKNTACLIGPEGDFTAEERSRLVDAGALPVSLGPHVMRSETAAVYAMSILRYETSA